MANVAVIKNGMVINTVYFSSEDEIEAFDFTSSAGKGAKGVLLDEGSSVSAGYAYSDGRFTPPEQTDEDSEKIKKHQTELNTSTKNGLLEQATTNITVWQTKLLIGRKLTDKETSYLNAWLDYIDEVSLIDANTFEEISWPVKPD